MSDEIIDSSKVQRGKKWDADSEVDHDRPEDFLTCNIFGKMYEISDGKTDKGRGNCPYCLERIEVNGNQGFYDYKAHEPYKPDKGRRPEIISTSLVVTPEFIAEEIYTPGKKPAFLLRRFEKEAIEQVPKIEVDGITYKPLDNETLRKRLILLPTGYEPCTFKQAYDAGCELAFSMYDVEASKKLEIRHLVAVAQGSYFFDRFTPDPKKNIPGMGSFAPILATRGASGSGKDRLLNALRLNSYKPFFDVSTRRIPSLYRPLNDWQGSLCLSEMDFRAGDETSELVHYLNCRSYGVPISRQNPDSVRKNEVFSNFGLTIVSQRYSWSDNATENRTLPYYCEKSQKPLATEELDEWLDEGMTQLNRLTYLRLMYWDKVKIDKKARVEGVRDHRLTASVLPLLAISKHEPSFKDSLTNVLLQFERRRKEVAANSKDGIVINYLWDSLAEGLAGELNGALWVGRLSEDGQVVPLTTSNLAEELRWSAREVRSVLNSLQLCAKADLPSNAHVNGKAYKAIWFDVERMEGRLLDFVPDYEKNTLFARIQSVLSVPSVRNGADSQKVLAKARTDGTDGTDIVRLENGKARSIDALLDQKEKTDGE